MPTANSAVHEQPTIKHNPRRRHFLTVAMGALFGLGLLVPAQALNAPAVEAASSRCAGWNSTTRPPDYIRVLRNKTGRIERVPFRKYVITVLGKEWPSYLPQAVVEAGAVATKQYAWYHTLGRARMTSNGRCFDVRDGTGDQLYKPAKARVRSDHYRAVDRTWGVSLLKHGKLFMTGYRRGAGQTGCARDATGWKLYAMSAKKCANKGWNYLQILRAYYSPGLVIRGGGSGSSSAQSVSQSSYDQSSTERSSNQQADAARVIDDRSRAIAWRGTWRRIRRSAAVGNTLTYSGMAGSSATFQFTGKSLEMVGPMGSRRGWIDVFVNGNRKARVSLWAPSGRHGVSLFEKEWRRSKTRTVKLVVVGNDTRWRGDIDAILIN